MRLADLGITAVETVTHRRRKIFVGERVVARHIARTPMRLTLMIQSVTNRREDFATPLPLVLPTFGSVSTDFRMLRITEPKSDWMQTRQSMRRSPASHLIRKSPTQSAAPHTPPQGETMATNIVHADDAISTRLFARWITDRYAFSIDKFIPIQQATVERLLEDDRFQSLPGLEGGYTNHLLYNDEALLVLSVKRVDGEKERSEAFFELFAKDIDTYRKWLDEVKRLDEACRRSSLLIEYHSFYIPRFGGIASNVEYFEKAIFDELRSDYYEPYLDVEAMFEAFEKSPSVILQFTGRPGLGKPKLIALYIRHLANTGRFIGRDNTLKIARPANSEVLAEEEFWVKLRQQGFAALILDDVDHILQKRNETVESAEEKLHNEIIRKILTFTDGLTSQKCKILISTNLEYRKIDKALIRDFRLFDSIELRPLSREEARNIWTERFGMPAEIFDARFAQDDEISAATLAKALDEHRDGGGRAHRHDGRRGYIKEEGSSKVESMRERRERVGLV